MKLDEVLKGNPAWKELFELTNEMLSSGTKTHDGGLYLAGLQLSKIVTRLANTEVNTKNNQIKK